MKKNCSNMANFTSFLHTFCILLASPFWSDGGRLFGVLGLLCCDASFHSEADEGMEGGESAELTLPHGGKRGEGGKAWRMGHV